MLCTKIPRFIYIFFPLLSFHRIFQTNAEDVADDVLQLGEPGVKIKEPNLIEKPHKTPFSTTTTMKQKRNRA